VIADINVGILFVFAISSLEVYAIIMGGWASNSKYPFLGALRSAAQMVSYEVSMGFVIVSVLLCVGSLNLTDIVMAQADGPRYHGWDMPKLAARLALVRRCSRCSSSSSSRRWPKPTVRPSTCPKRNPSWLQAHMVEYGSTPYMMFMLGEYAAIVLMCALTTILFLGGWLPPVDVWFLSWVPGIVWFVLKVCLVFFMFSMVKAFVPRYRYDQLMRLGWKVFPADLARHAGDRGLRAEADGDRPMMPDHLTSTIRR
jgi:NADH-quinone oxidoreductase subunit H